MLFSTNYQPDHWMFKVKPETTIEFILFIIPACFMAAIASLAGHEMVHYREGVHKVFGSIPFALMFYTHFHDEHVRGHHKTVGTREDPTFAPTGTNVYLSSFASIFHTHKTTWEREVERITRKNPKVSFLGILAQNIMVHYFILHAAMIYGIYNIFGMGGL
jgi:alkane 1-monooxygenase